MFASDAICIFCDSLSIYMRTRAMVLKIVREKQTSVNVISFSDDASILSQEARKKNDTTFCQALIEESSRARARRCRKMKDYPRDRCASLMCSSTSARAMTRAAGAVRTTTSLFSFSLVVARHLSFAKTRSSHYLSPREHNALRVQYLRARGNDFPYRTRNWNVTSA